MMRLKMRKMKAAKAMLKLKKVLLLPRAKRLK
jgi:hypothetical protein